MNIFAGNLPKEVTEDDLRTAFRAYGQVSFVNIVKARSNGISSGFGFLEMPVQMEAEAAISGLNGKNMKGKAIIVNEARPRPKDIGEIAR